MGRGRKSRSKPSWFMDPEGDVYFITSDEITFRISMQRLAHESDIIQDMFAVACPSGENKPKDGTENDPIKIEEPSDIFDTLLRHIYQQDMSRNIPYSLDHNFSSIVAARKYFMTRVTKSLVDSLMVSGYMKSNPGRVYAFACLHELSDLAKRASDETLRCGILNVHMGIEGDFITGRQYQDLIDRHQRRTTRSLNIIDKFERGVEHRGSRSNGGWGGCTIDWDTPQTPNPYRPKDMRYPSCSCNLDINRPPQWFYYFCTYAKMELNRAPVSEHLFSGKTMLSILKGIECRDCSKSMHDNWEKLEQLKSEIDAEDAVEAFHDENYGAYENITFPDGLGDLFGPHTPPPGPMQ